MDITEKLNKHLEEQGITYTHFEPGFAPCLVQATIHWGDWKHEHLRLKVVVEEWLRSQGIKWTYFQTTTEEDGSDCYSAEHTIMIH